MDGVNEATTATGMFYKSLPLIIVNGATLLIVVVMMIRRGAKSEERLINSLTFAITGLKDEVVGLRRDIRETGTAAAVAIGHLTERVSRIEGKIEWIARDQPHHELHADSEDEDTPVNAPIPRVPKRPGTGDNIYVDPTLTEQQTPVGARRTPPGGVPRVAGGYSLGKPRGKP